MKAMGGKSGAEEMQAAVIKKTPISASNPHGVKTIYRKDVIDNKEVYEH